MKSSMTIKPHRSVTITEKQPYSAMVKPSKKKYSAEVIKKARSAYIK